MHVLYAFHREPVWRSTKADASASVTSKVSVFPPERATNAVVVSEVGWCTISTAAAKAVDDAPLQGLEAEDWLAPSRRCR